MTKPKNKKSDFFDEEDEEDVPESPKEEKKEEPSKLVNSKEKSFLGDQERTRAALAKEPKIPFIIPLYEGEKAGIARESVTINGYRFDIQKGKMMDLPKSVVELLSAHYQIQLGGSAFGQKFDIDRKEDVKNALS